ncbi:MAG: PAS domain S-box protein [Sulfurimonas sp.]|uniref:PAS domain-containing sensor histidine kinase n=1 Tax=Sulfurimonas sp. TaxID=2022749 RepID=UPI0025EC5F84|nr:PAS domain S-box protein [Sulfurimonas sp.]MCK9492211.1 PAS domain S-box protein [Sulfurimonas sp.]
MKNKISPKLKNIRSSILTPIAFLLMAIFAILFFYTPYMADKNIIDIAKEGSIIVLALVTYTSYTLVKREKRLLKTNDKLEKKLKNILLDFDKNVIASTTDMDGKITYASELFCKLSGYKKEELIGRNHNLIKHGDMPKAMYEEMLKTLQAGKTWRGEIKNSTKDGGFYWVDAIVSPVLDGSGKVIEYNSIRQDITSKKELENLNESLKARISKAIAEAQEKEQHMLKQSKMAQMGEMLSMIAHQWRQPLAAISSTASSLEVKMILKDIDIATLKSGIKDIQAYSQHLSSTINDFRNFFIDSKVLTKTSFESILNKTIQIVKTSLDKRDIIISFQNHFEDEFCIYENEFEQVVLNLIKNAEDAIVENSIKNGIIEIKTYKLNGKAVFEVFDNARGIDNALMEKIFDPYFSTKSKKNGTGLGLYMSKIIIENHCFGTLEAFNTFEGAMFRITLNPNEFSLPPDATQ